MTKFFNSLRNSHTKTPGREPCPKPFRDQQTKCTDFRILHKKKRKKKNCDSLTMIIASVVPCPGIHPNYKSSILIDLLICISTTRCRSLRLGPSIKSITFFCIRIEDIIFQYTESFYLSILVQWIYRFNFLGFYLAWPTELIIKLQQMVYLTQQCLF